MLVVLVAAWHCLVVPEARRVVMFACLQAQERLAVAVPCK
jgi:hypothetical protein